MYPHLTFREVSRIRNAKHIFVDNHCRRNFDSSWSTDTESPGFRSCGSGVGSVWAGQAGFRGCFGVGGVCLPCRWGWLGVFGLVSVGLR